MKSFLLGILALVAAASIGGADELTTDENKHPSRESTAAAGDPTDAHLKLLRITATIDGSGRMIFTRDSVRYEHKFWDEPQNVVFDGEAWSDLSQPLAAWRDLAKHLDLTKAWVVKRNGRDVIALEHTADGFDLYFCDSPEGADEYEVILAIPRVN